jgi:hypothetical protein
MSRSTILFRIAVCAGALGLLASCEEMPVNQSSTSAAVAPTPPTGYWNGDGVSGSPKIVVSISEQRAYFYKGKQLVGETTVSTGKPGFGTPPGRYTVLSKNAEHVSSVFGDYVDDFGTVVKSNIDSRKDPKPKGSHYDGARMPFAMFFRGGYAMHQGYVPPYAASHGCIRLPKDMAETFFNASPPGTPVIVKEEAVMHSVPAPSLASVPPPTFASPAPEVVRYPAPVPVRQTVARATLPALTPVPVRSTAPVSYRSAPPASVRATPPPKRSLAPGPNPSRSPSRFPTPTPSPTPRR